MRGVYITERVTVSNKDKVTGFVLSVTSGSRWSVQTFTRCTLATVEENAARVIHNPTTYDITEGNS